jgi:hypothetical protein
MVSSLMRRFGAARAARLSICFSASALACAGLATGLLLAYAGDAWAFPLWPKGKSHADERAKQDEANDDQAKGGLGKDGKGKDKANQGKKNSDGTSSAEAASDKSDSTMPNVPVNFVPVTSSPRNGENGNGGSSTNGNGNGNGYRTTNGNGNGVTPNRDPMAIYRSCGVNPVEERKIRQLVQEFEGMQRVRLKLLSNLLEEMRQFGLQTDPDPKAVIAKQDEINKLTSTMADDRIKLLLAIRDIMSPDEKQHLIDTLQSERH